MLTNEMIKRIHDNAVAHGFHDPDSEPTFGEYCALIHEEISEAFSAWRNGEPDEYVKDGKPEGVWVELADVVIRCADFAGQVGIDFDKMAKTELNDAYNEIRELLKDNQEEEFPEHITVYHNMVSLAHMHESDNERRYRYMLYLVIYIFTLADHNGIDLDAIIERKHAYNVTRPWRHGKRM